MIPAPANDVSLATRLTRNSVLRDLGDAVTGALYTKLVADREFELAEEPADVGPAYTAMLTAKDALIAAYAAHFAAVQAIVSGDIGEQLEAMRPWVEARLEARKAVQP